MLDCMETTSTPMSGRRAQAARNDTLILDAAREVFLADPSAPISAVAERAGVGISALYRRYASKDELLQRLASDGLQRYIAETEAALADDGDPWNAFTGFMSRCVEAGSSSLTQRLSGSFTATEELNREGYRASQLTQELLDRTKATGGLRPDIEVGDLSLLFEQLQSVQVKDPDRARQLRQRYLTLLLEAMHSPFVTPLPGPPPSWQEISGRYND
ncbi:MAG: putative transcriptional regulator, TetR family [Actinomycetia bacterium]|nr:putative transcriptional regulator, TetR family [Actinomycetes bacterium]